MRRWPTQQRSSQLHSGSCAALTRWHSRLWLHMKHGRVLHVLQQLDCSQPQPNSECVCICSPHSITSWPEHAVFPVFALSQNCVLPVALACNSNTLELPDYAEALVATVPELQQEWSNAVVGAPVDASSKHAGGNLSSTACPKLWQACCKLLDERMQVGDCGVCCWTVPMLSRTRQHTAGMSHTTQFLCMFVCAGETAASHQIGRRCR